MVMKSLIYLKGRRIAEVRFKHPPRNGEYISYEGDMYIVESILHYPMGDSEFDLLIHLNDVDV